MLRDELAAMRSYATNKKPGAAKGTGSVALAVQASLVAGAGSNLHLLPEQVKMVAGTGVDHNLQSTPVKMVAGGRNHLFLRYSASHPLKATAAHEVAKTAVVPASFLKMLFQAAA